VIAMAIKVINSENVYKIGRISIRHEDFGEMSQDIPKEPGVVFWLSPEEGEKKRTAKEVTLVGVEPEKISENDFTILEAALQAALAAAEITEENLLSTSAEVLDEIGERVGEEWLRQSRFEYESETFE